MYIYTYIYMYILYIYVYYIYIYIYIYIIYIFVYSYKTLEDNFVSSQLPGWDCLIATPGRFFSSSLLFLHIIYVYSYVTTSCHSHVVLEMFSTPKRDDCHTSLGYHYHCSQQIF